MMMMMAITSPPTNLPAHPMGCRNSGFSHTRVHPGYRVPKMLGTLHMNHGWYNESGEIAIKSLCQARSLQAL